MTTAIQPAKQTTPAPKPSALNLMASRLSCDPTKLLATLKATVFKGANDEEVMALCLVANEYQLNPLLKEMYAFPAKGGGITPIVSVDGWNKMLLRQENYDGKSFSFTYDEQGKLQSCTATIYIKGRDRAETITEYFDECQRNSDNWKNMPHRMLRNRTLCQAARMAFGFSGVYHEEEVQSINIDSMVLPPKQIGADGSIESQKIVSEPSKITPQAELEALVVGADFTLNHLIAYGTDSGNIDNADSLTLFSEISTENAKRLLRSPTGLLKALQVIKEAK